MGPFGFRFRGIYIYLNYVYVHVNVYVYAYVYVYVHVYVYVYDVYVEREIHKEKQQLKKRPEFKDLIFVTFLTDFCSVLFLSSDAALIPCVGHGIWC